MIIKIKKVFVALRHVVFDCIKHSSYTVLIFTVVIETNNIIKLIDSNTTNIHNVTIVTSSLKCYTE